MQQLHVHREGKVCTTILHNFYHEKNLEATPSGNWVKICWYTCTMLQVKLLMERFVGEDSELHTCNNWTFHPAPRTARNARFLTHNNSKAFLRAGKHTAEREQEILHFHLQREHCKVAQCAQRQYQKVSQPGPAGIS